MEKENNVQDVKEGKIRDVPLPIEHEGVYCGRC